MNLLPLVSFYKISIHFIIYLFYSSLDFAFNLHCLKFLSERKRVFHVNLSSHYYHWHWQKVSFYECFISLECSVYYMCLVTYACKYYSVELLNQVIISWPSDNILICQVIIFSWVIISCP